MKETSPFQREGLKIEVSRILRTYQRDPDAPDRTDLLRRAAEKLVELRATFVGADGEPDWKGATHAYKSAVSEIYSLAGLSREEQYRVANAVRYHTGEALRAALTDEQVEELGLRALSPRGRSTEKREKQRELLDALQRPGEGSPIEPLRGAASAYALLSHIAEEDIAELSDTQRRRLLTSLSKVAGEVKRIRDASK